MVWWGSRVDAPRLREMGGLSGVGAAARRAGGSRRWRGGDGRKRRNIYTGEGTPASRDGGGGVGGQDKFPVRRHVCKPRAQGV
eukprot:gene21800-biopygen13227